MAGVVEVVVARADVDGAAAEFAIEAVVADCSPPSSQAAASEIAAMSRNRVVGRIAQIYQVRDGVRSRPEGA